MNAKDAKGVIQELIKEKWFQTNFGGGITEEALHRSITALDKEINPDRVRPYYLQSKKK